MKKYTEDELRKMFLKLFLWVADNRPEWLQEAIDKRRSELGERI